MASGPLPFLGAPYRRSLIDDVTGNVTVAPEAQDPNEVVQRGMLLPLGRTRAGDTVLASQAPIHGLGMLAGNLVSSLPGAIPEAISAAQYPGQVWRGEKSVFGPDGHVTDEALGAANGIAGLAMTGSMPFSAPKGALRVFGGSSAETADHAALQQALDLTKSGADRRAIWDQTGWFKGPDDRWKFEIPDDAASLTPTKTGPRFFGNGPAESLVQHEPLFSAYPHLADRLTRIEGAPNWPDGGSFSPTGAIYSTGPDQETVRSILLHELQHAVQHDEGFAKGGSPENYSRQDWEKSILDTAANNKWRAVDAYPEAAQAYRALNEHKNDLVWKHGQDWGAKASEAELARLDNLEATLASKPGGQQIADADWAHQSAIAQVGAPEARAQFKDWADDQYHRQAGEVEARNVQTRRDFTPEQRRAIPPWETQDVSDAQQIVRFYSGGPAGIVGLPFLGRDR